VEDRNDEMMRALVESVARLEEHLRSINEKLEMLEGINRKLKSIEFSIPGNRYRSTYAWAD
jgi:hypothetical protein